jgi:hypothetical protein
MHVLMRLAETDEGDMAGDDVSAVRCVTANSLALARADLDTELTGERRASLQECVCVIVQALRRNRSDAPAISSSMLR